MENGTNCQDCGKFVTTAICMRKINKSVCEACARKDKYRQFKARTTISYIPRKGKVVIPPYLCQECAVEHSPNYPHDKNSTYYRDRFKQKHGRYPTWDDALSHCTEEMKISWKESMERVQKATDSLWE